MSTRHKHRWQRLSDVALFCACGDTKYVVEPVCTRPHYYPWVYPYTTVPYYPWWQSQTISVGTTSIGGTTSDPHLDGSSVTYTLTSGTALE